MAVFCAAALWAERGVMAFVLSAQGLVCHCVSGQPVAMTHTRTLRVPRLTEETHEFNVQHPEIHMPGGGSADEKVLVNGAKSAVFPPFFVLCKNLQEFALHLPRFPPQANSLSGTVASASLDFLLI